LEQLRECSLVLAEESGVRCPVLGAGAGSPEHPSLVAGYLTPERHVPEMRYRLLEALREYGAEQLAQEERAEVRRRHLQYYMALAEQAGEEAGSPERPLRLDHLEQEHDNL